MVDDPAATPRKPRRKGGRPSRAEASAKALLGVDVAACDPVSVLRDPGRSFDAGLHAGERSKGPTRAAGVVGVADGC